MPSPAPSAHQCEQASFADRLYGDLLDRHPGLARGAAADPVLGRALRERAADLARLHLTAYGCCFAATAAAVPGGPAAVPAAPAAPPRTASPTSPLAAQPAAPLAA